MKDSQTSKDGPQKEVWVKKDDIPGLLEMSDPAPQSDTLQGRIEELLMEVSYQGSMMPRGKTLSPFMFRREAKALADLFMAETEELVGEDDPEELRSDFWERNQLRKEILDKARRKYGK